MASVATTYLRQGQGRFAGLVWTLIRTDFKTRYHGTLGGFVWALLKPLTMFLVLLAVFSYVFAADPQYKLDLIIGLFLYEFFQEATKAGLLSIRAKGYLLTKAPFPSWIVVVTSTSNAVITLALFSLVLLVFLALTGRAPAPRSVLLRTRFGEKVQTPVIAPPSGMLSGLLGRKSAGAGAMAALDAVPGLPDELISALETRAIWGKFGF